MILLTLLRSLVSTKLTTDPRFIARAAAVHSVSAAPRSTSVTAQSRVYIVKAAKNHAQKAPTRVYTVTP